VTGKLISLDGHTIDVTHQDKPLFPEDGVTKGDLVYYYQRVAPIMVRHLAGRPLVMQRFPDGIDDEGFFQQDVPDYFPDWIDRVAVAKKGGSVEHIECDTAASLIYVADQACITLHVWLSSASDVDRPDRLVLDLDPPDDDPDAVRSAARQTGDLLEGVGLVPFLMTTGSRGYHVVAPIEREMDFTATHELARDMALLLQKRDPGHLTAERRKEERGDRVFVDYLRNSYGQTHVAPYSVRPLSGAPVATPITWEELGEVEPRHFSIEAMLHRLRQKKDPWEDIGAHARSPKEARRALDAALQEAGPPPSG
jgi:bifunctional non-homologous end joining protein LigD